MTPDLTAPLVLGWVRALDRALELRNLGLTYPALAFVMAEYHGWTVGTDTWRKHLYERGVAKHPARVANGQARREAA